MDPRPWNVHPQSGHGNGSVDCGGLELIRVVRSTNCCEVCSPTLLVSFPSICSGVSKMLVNVSRYGIQWLLFLHLMSLVKNRERVVKDIDQNFSTIFHWAIYTVNKTFPLEKKTKKGRDVRNSSLKVGEKLHPISIPDLEDRSYWLYKGLIS